MYVNIRCPNCFREIGSESLDVQKQEAKCTACNTIFSLKHTFEKELRNKVNIEQPARFDVLNIENSELDIKYNFQFKSSIVTYILLLVVSKNVSIYISIFVALAIFSKLILSSWLIFNIIILVAISILLYNLYSISKKIHSNINIKDGVLSIENPVFDINKQIQKGVDDFLVERQFSIETKDIDQLFIQETMSKKGKVIDLFILNFKLKDGSQITPILPLLKLKEALFIEQEIEKHIGIIDVKMPNEYKT